MDDDEPTRTLRPAPGRVPRRVFLQTTAWSAPVVLAAVPAPATAASVGPLVVTAYKTIITQQVALAFSGGQNNLPVTVVDVSVRFNNTNYDVSTSPNTVSSTNGVSYGRLLSSWIFLALNYTVVYVFNGQTYTTVVSA